MTRPVLARWRRWLLVLIALAAAWAAAVAITGGFVVRLGSMRLSSRRWQVAALVALVGAAAAWMSSTPDERRQAWRRLRDWRRWPWWADGAVVLALVGAGVRIALWAVGRPMWLDEEMIALNLRDRPVGELSGALWLGQTAPLGWMVLQRAMLVAWGTSEMALRAVPLAFGMATVATAAWVGHRWMNRLGGAVLVAFCAFGQWLLYNSTELKPYSSDAFWGLLVPVVAAWAADAAPGGPTTNTRRVTIWWLVAAVGHWFGNGALLVTPACAVVLCVVFFQRGGWQGAARAALPGLLWLASFGLHYVFAMREAAGSAYLASYWAFAMPPSSGGLAGRLAWIPTQFEPLARNPGGVRPWVLFWIAAVGGFVLTPHRALGAMLAGVPLSAFALAVLGIYPLYERLSLWALPALYTGVALFVDRAFLAATRAMARRRWMPAGAGLVLAAAGVWVCADVVRTGAGDVPGSLRARDNHQLDDRAGVKWLLQFQRPGDVIVTTHLAQPALWWYGGVPMRDAAGAGRHLPDGSPILVVGYAAARRECPGNELRAALAGRQRALVYLGFRFDDVPKGFDQRLLDTLGELGPIVASETFEGFGRAVVVDLLPRSVAAAGPSGARPRDTAGLRSGCLTVEDARRW